MVVGRSCNFQTKDPTAWFNPDCPDGVFNLDMEDGYERAVMVDLLHMAANNDAVSISSLTYKRKLESGFSEPQAVKLEVAWENSAGSKIRVVKTSVEAIQEAFDRYAALHRAGDIPPGLTMTCCVFRFSKTKERLKKDEVSKALAWLNLGPYPEVKIHEFIAYYDPDSSHSLTFGEFEDLCLFEAQVDEETRPRRFYMREGELPK